MPARRNIVEVSTRIKSLNYLNNVYQDRGKSGGVSEAILLNNEVMSLSAPR